MIRLIQGKDWTRHAYELDAMFRSRAHVFSDRLKWDVAVTDGREIDEFDDLNPLYLVCVDDVTGSTRGSLRLLPTTAPHMLDRCFAKAFGEEIAIKSSTIWECTRFCLHPEAGPSQVTSTGAMRDTLELMLGICEVGQLAGLTFIQGVYDKSMLRIYKKTRWSPVTIAKSTTLGRLPVYVGLWEISEAAIEKMRKTGWITDSVLEKKAAAALPKVA